MFASGYQICSRQQYLFDKSLLLYVQSGTRDDERKNRPKYVECHSKTNGFDTLVNLILYGCESWSLTLREKRKMRAFENMVLKRIFDLGGTR